jgi:cellulose synthase/poly-beta-1,6-N-acetylglucosamine synthase-like glycosyltransferase
MSLGIDPIISNFFFSLNLIPHFAKVHRSGKDPHSNSLPLVTVIVALYKEKPEDIAITVRSLMAQTYPKDRYEILFALEPDERETIDEIGSWTEHLGRIGIAARAILSDGKSTTKPPALNQTIQCATGEYCVFYDASDEIAPDQIEKGISLMTLENYDVVQSKVLRKGCSILSRFLLLDTAIWYWKYLPVLSRFLTMSPKTHVSENAVATAVFLLLAV